MPLVSWRTIPFAIGIVVVICPRVEFKPFTRNSPWGENSPMEAFGYMQFKMVFVKAVSLRVTLQP